MNIVFANGFYIPVQAPEATGRGNAWLATADTAAAVYYNAAGLTQMAESEISLGIYSVRLGIEADTPFGTFENNASWALIPQIYAALPISEKTVLGFGLNTPFGLATEWDDQVPFRQLAIETKLDYLTGWFVAGHKVTDTLSIGGGFGVHRADANLRQGISFAPATDSFRFEGDDEALSWTLSARWEPCKEHAVGLVYRSKADFNLEGKARTVPYIPGSEKASLDFLTPATAAIGYAYRPDENWVFEANLEWVNWDELNDLKISKASGPAILPFRWNSNMIYSLGATRFLENGWNLSGGYNYIENSQPNSTFNPGISDADRHWLNVGIGRKYESVEWNFAYQYAFSDRVVEGSPFGIADGKYKSRFQGLMMNCRWSF
ncbi:MAG: outer membrane protein transport protein [Armatimonadetes bacterium]|nr:outer membrane protein transport protein [Akkermansiaceae bacterium]